MGILCSPVSGITGCWKFSRPAWFRSSAESLPAHLLHYVLSGDYEVRISGRRYSPSPGDMLYYYGCDSVEWIGNSSEVTFLSVGFTSRSLPILSVLERWITGCNELEGDWIKLWQTCGMQEEGETADQGLINGFKAFSYLLKILEPVYESEYSGRNIQSVSETDWMKAERYVLERRLFRIGISNLAEAVGIGEKKLHRSCMEDYNTSPARRLKHLCMNEARGQLLYSELNISEIADYLHYPRVHEFSRDFKLSEGTSPTVYRRLGTV